MLRSMFRLWTGLLVLGISVQAAPAANLATKGVQPAVAANEAGLVAVAWGQGATAACAVSHDGGANFDKTVALGTIAGGQMVGMRRGPQIAVRGETLVVATNDQRNRRIMVFRSTDAGRTWIGPTAIDDPAGRSAEGLMSLGATRDGFAVVWLELFDKSMRIALTRSTDDGATWGKSQLVYASPNGHVCECCQPTMASDRTGTVAVMWRNTLGGNRDIYVALSTDDGQSFGKPEKAGQGAWKLDACPMDGGGIALVRGNKWLSIWRRGNTVYTAGPGEAETKLSTGRQGTVAAVTGGVVLAWETDQGVVVHSPEGREELVAGGTMPVLAATNKGRRAVLAYNVRVGEETQVQTKIVCEAKTQP